MTLLAFMKGTFLFKKCSVPFKNSLARTLHMIQIVQIHGNNHLLNMYIDTHFQYNVPNLYKLTTSNPQSVQTMI